MTQNFEGELEVRFLTILIDIDNYSSYFPTIEGN